MPHITIIAEPGSDTVKLKDGLTRSGFTCSMLSQKHVTAGHVNEPAPDLLLIRISDASNAPEISALSQKFVKGKRIPVIALVEKNALASDEINPEVIDDFAVTPPDMNELVVRAKRLIHKAKRSESGAVITQGDLAIDVPRCEVTVKGVPVELTYKEYELLRFLASSKGRVFTRDALLNKVWGYDYYGGDRTVDVHIRRLRSKIETSPGETYIETVRNIGYRFKTRQ